MSVAPARPAFETPAAPPTSALSDDPILFYDGECGLCQKSVQFVLNHDRAGRVRFARLQGDVARRSLPQSDYENMKTMVMLRHGGRYRYSSALVRLLWSMGGPWTAIAAALWIVPKPIRDLGYYAFASQRYRFFGHADQCRLPQPHERNRFLD